MLDLVVPPKAGRRLVVSGREECSEAPIWMRGFTVLQRLRHAEWLPTSAAPRTSPLKSRPTLKACVSKRDSADPWVGTNPVGLGAQHSESVGT